MRVDEESHSTELNRSLGSEPPWTAAGARLPSVCNVTWPEQLSSGRLIANPS